jgi:uncharacterized membrane protein
MNKLEDVYLKKSSTVLSKLPSFVAIILLIQVTLYISFFFNIPIVRQVIGFVYLTFVPGFVIMKLLKQDNLGLVETILFSVGLSVAFVMLTGLALNELGFIVGIKQPLDPSLLVLVFSGIVLLGTLACYFRGAKDLHLFRLTKGTIIRLFVLFLLPILSVVGTYFANVTGKTSILILDLLAILVLFIIMVFSKRLFTPNFHLIIVFIIAITLLSQYSLISNYVQGFDIKVEYYVATLTNNSGFWNSSASFADIGLGRFYSMLSVTLLPKIFSNIIDMDITWVFKIVYPLIFSIVPMALYILWREKFGVTVAFLAAFLFMSQTTFYTDMLSLARQMIAEVFFVLLFLFLFSKNLSSKNVKILFFIFGFCLIDSHYSLALIFAFSISLWWLIGYLTKKRNRNLSLSMVILFLVLMFSWFVITVSSANILSISSSSLRILSGFSDFFNPAFRGTVVMQGIGAAGSLSTPLYNISRVVAYATEFFIMLGFVALFLQRKKKNFDFEYLIPCFASLIILILCILVPNFASSFNMTRFYHVFLFFLAPLFAIGCIELFRFAAKFLKVTPKRKTEIFSLILMTLVIGAYFLFQTNLIYEVTGEESWSLPLSRYRLGYRLYVDFWYVTGQQISSGEWLSQNTNPSNLVVYADTSVINNIVAYGGINPANINNIYDVMAPQYGEFVYLAELNGLFDKVVYNYQVGNTSDILGSKPLSVIYNNGLCEMLTITVPPS